jgi:hypothetical protein
MSVITGSGTNTNPQEVVWFCHLCGALEMGVAA